MDADFVAILEVCGFNDWLIAELHKWKCHEVVLIHPLHFRGSHSEGN
jgi:hypothetical protein